MVNQKTSWGVPCPSDLRGLFKVPEANADIMVSSKGFLRADTSCIFIGDHDLPESHSLNFHKHTLVSLEQQLGILFRTYRTRKGFRTIGLCAVRPPRKTSSMLLYSSECDERYVTVAKETNRYSCRLTPKPQRLGLKWKTADYLCFRDKGLDCKFLDFFRTYSELCSGYSVCSYISGPLSQDPNINEFIAFHDRVTKAHEILPLA